MEYRFIYSQCQLDKAVDFIADNNSCFLNQHDKIRQSILKTINEVIDHFPKYRSMSTIGYYIETAQGSVEDMDNDDNVIVIDILIDPSVGRNYINIEESDDVEIIRDIKKERLKGN